MKTPPHNARRVVVVGMGRTGLSVARYLHRQGWRVAATDSRAEPPERAALSAISDELVLRAGGFDSSLLSDAQLVMASPGVALNEPIFAAARDRGIEIVGDIELFARAVDAPVVGITGTNGKSTVTTLLGRMAERAGVRVRVGGNLGQPALDLLGRGPVDLYILELSSFQLETTQRLALKAAAVLNVTSDHLDRYASLADYAAAKARIFTHCDTAVINLDDPLVVAMQHATPRTFTYSLQTAAAADFSLATNPETHQPWLTRRGEVLLPAAAIKLAGLHNVANALAALALGEALRLPRAAMLEELQEFAGLPHRTEWVADVDAVRYLNDSKGTNVGATLAAVAGLDGPLIVIAGGDGKRQDFAPLAAAFRGKVRLAVLIGRDAPTLAAVLADVCEVQQAATLESAVGLAHDAAQAGDTVLLSPACASVDMFRDYAHRGSVFMSAVRALAA